MQGLSRTITRPQPTSNRHTQAHAPESQRVQPQVSCLALALSHPSCLLLLICPSPENRHSLSRVPLHL